MSPEMAVSTSNRNLSGSSRKRVLDRESTIKNDPRTSLQGSGATQSGGLTVYALEGYKTSENRCKSVFWVTSLRNNVISAFFAGFLGKPLFSLLDVCPLAD